jgi:RHS repeat-associated protein
MYQKDLFYMQLQYDNLFSGVAGTLRKDGNISQAIWRVRGRERQAYSYTYDGLQRISTANYSDINDAGTITTSNRYNTSYTYADLRGNISNNQRNGLFLSGACYTQALLDNMTYTYTSGSNKISSISDAANVTQGGFRAASGAYAYDNNGNQISNAAKGITSISYNHLNLPSNITLSGSRTIDFTYAADGSKLRKVVKTGATINLVQEYVNGIEYRGTAIPATTMEGIYHAEGRLYNNAGTWQREYAIKDHLGDTRIAYADINGDGVIATPSEILQENIYDAFGYGLDGVYMNHSNPDNLYQYNGKELNNDHSIGMYDYGARWYDAGVGRFNTIDRYALKFPFFSSYQYGGNNPIKFIDINGDSIFVNNVGTITRNDYTDNSVFLQQNGQLSFIGTLGGQIDANNIFTNLLEQNTKEAKDIYWPFTFYNKVRNKGKYDIKNDKNSIFGLANNKEYKATKFSFRSKSYSSSDLGNFQFGVLSKASPSLSFLSEEGILKQAGSAQIEAGTSRPEWQIYKSITVYHSITPTTMNVMQPPYCDDPRDQEMIIEGFRFFQNSTKKKP